MDDLFCLERPNQLQTLQDAYLAFFCEVFQALIIVRYIN
jgi:hypothetical protein